MRIDVSGEAVPNATPAASMQRARYGNRAQKLPVSFDAVTPDWLTQTLQSRYPALVVSDMEVIEFINGHTTKVRVRLDLNSAGIDAGVPRHVCLKANWSGEFQTLDIWANEARFYREVRDVLPIPAPICYFADWDAEGQGVVVLEDLVAAGGKFGKSTSPITVDEAARALDGFAALHAGWWGRPELEELSWLPQSMGPATKPDDLYRTLAEVIRANDVLPERIALLPQWLIDDPSRLGRAFDALRAHETNKQGARCVIHGDAHLGNTYVGKDGHRMWIDWQMARRGRPWRDLAWFLIGALEIEDRRRAERELLQHYLERLASLGVEGMRFEEAWFEYRRWPMWGIVAWQGNLDAWGQPSLAPLARFVAAAEDHETLRLLGA